MSGPIYVGHGTISGHPDIDRGLRRQALSDDMAEMLLRLEWETYSTNGVIGICPCCNGYEEVGYGGGGHRENCSLAKLLEHIR